MGETFIEIYLLSARQLLFGARFGFGCSLLKHQWYAVGWINPKDKYRTTINASRSCNTIWKTMFDTSLDDDDDDDDDDSKIHALHVEVYRREPIFLTKKLHGSVTVPLKQFLAKYKNQSSSSSVFEETFSCQLRKQNTKGVILLSTNSSYNSSGQNDMAGSSQHPFATLNQPNSSNSFSVPPDNHHFPMPNPLTNNTSPHTQQPYYPPPPPMHQPYYPPSFMPRSENDVNIPSSSSSSSGGAGRSYARPEPEPGAGKGGFRNKFSWGRKKVPYYI